MTGTLLDTSVIIDLFHDGLNKRQLDTAMANNPAISIITFIELCRYLHQAGKMREWNEIKSRLADYKLLPLTPEVGERAAEISTKKSLSLADSIIYATALESNMKLVTRDNEFRNLPNVIVL